MGVTTREASKAVSLSVALTMRRNRERVKETIAHRKLRKKVEVSEAEFVLSVIKGTHKTMTKISPAYKFKPRLIILPNPKGWV